MSYWQMAKAGYQQLVNAIIRPPRCNYMEDHLGPPLFTLGGKKFQRKDFELRNTRGLKLVCSRWSPVQRPNDVLPCVIYMHGNSSARLEGIPQLTTVLSLGATLLSFDFSGSGQSEGDYVSLGAYEKDDLKAVIEFLREEGQTSSIALWGRSMGAATSLLHGERDPSIAGMILDSAFSDLQTLAEEIVDKGRKSGLFVPGFVVYIAIRWIRSSVLKTAKFDIRTLSPIKHAHKCFIPALFVAAEGDDFVPAHHSKKIYEKYAGDKNLIVVDGDHNSVRPKFLYDSVSIFLTQVLQIPDHWVLNVNRNSQAQPPWYGDSYEYNYDGQEQEIDEEEIGMTEKRQENIHRALRNLMGNNTMTAASSSQEETSPNSNMKVLASSGTERHQPIKDGHSRGNNISVDVDTTLTQPPPPPDTLVDGQQNYLLSAQDWPESEWECDRCTLINENVTNFCTACGYNYIRKSNN